ncbi:S-adenosyl-L-methionine-dependent methyltransferase [Kockovaella imperatae]|uniref:S-adenosyl-L-methionine-dependent methyltransferase n=1 Tax=Kockovaella imperatae TaxID=4999 RepID=A0A1Y1UCX2_9TREE|nr:S-adenosyl-L-methionine-dependent methyltransferase [Kockovaella imperatae]ORX35366.1 S-adenosyl-L-methionine-dependent methyltransferase [Kockovaella imperatae]
MSISTSRGAWRLARQLRAPGRRLSVPVSRSNYATVSSSPSTSPYEVFDETSKTRQRDRAVIRLNEEGSSSLIDYVREELAERLADRVEDLRTPPNRIVEIGSHAGQLTRVLQEVLGPDTAFTDEKREWWMVEQSREALYRDELPLPTKRIQTLPSNLLADPTMDALRDKVDAVVSASGLHWVGDIVGCLTQIKHLLKPDGVFIGAVLGGDTLFELRTSLQLAEQERHGGLANRVSPMISRVLFWDLASLIVDPTDAPSLLNRAGFTLTTVDVEDITINYPSMWELIADLRDMGESNAILGRKAMISRDVLIAAESIYRELYSKEEGSVPATFQAVFMIGWRPGPNQPQALERGSADTNLKSILE